MTPTSECISLLRAIAVAPDDDLPRLVFADWLDEHATTDADAARAEFIRRSCPLKAKQRLSPAEGKWLDANVRRLLPTVTAKLKQTGADDGISRSGRRVRIYTSLDPDEEFGPGQVFLEIEYWRGFARRIDYGSVQATGLTNLGRELAADEPLAVHGSEFRAKMFVQSQRMLTHVSPDLCQGLAAWELLTGHDCLDVSGRKVFAFPGGTNAEWVRFADDVILANVARAMTAVAREGTGWPIDWAAGT